MAAITLTQAETLQSLLLGGSKSRNLERGKNSLGSKSGGESQAPMRRPGHSAASKKRFAPAIQICCLGYFSIRRAGDGPINIRMNTRPGALLQLLIAVGPGGIEKHQAANLLWPQPDGKTAHGALDSTLYRLRQLLDIDAACRAEHGVIMLDRSIVSIDAWVFDDEAESLLVRLKRPADNLDGGEIAIRCQRLLELYLGPFLALETSAPWILRTRDRLQAKFVRVMEEAGQFWQSTGRWDRAVRLYEQALESDNLSEAIYRELIRCHLAQGHLSEAIGAFYRCRELLASVLGVAPSEETTALYRCALVVNQGDVEI